MVLRRIVDSYHCSIGRHGGLGNIWSDQFIELLSFIEYGFNMIETKSKTHKGNLK